MEAKARIVVKTLETEVDQPEGFQGFPGRFYVLAIPQDKYAALNATLPDLQVLDGIVCFPEPEDAVKFMELPSPKSIQGRITSMTFEEARQVALSRPRLNSLILHIQGRIADYHFVR